jgi:hypothetical protein
MSIEPYRGPRSNGRPNRLTTMEDRLRRHKAMKLIEPHTEELVAWHLAEFRNPENTKLERHKFAKFLWEACYGKPGQAIQVEAAPDVQRTLIVRWMPPDPNDRSNVIEPEPD